MSLGMSCHSTTHCQCRVTPSAQQMPDPKASDITWRRSVWWGKPISQLLLLLNVEDAFSISTLPPKALHYLLLPSGCFPQRLFALTHFLHCVHNPRPSPTEYRNAISDSPSHLSPSFSSSLFQKKQLKPFARNWYCLR